MIRDTIVSGSRRLRAVARAARFGGTYLAADGTPVTVYSSDAYAPNSAVNQAYATFLGTLVHGPELGRLTVYVAPYAEMASICSAEADACYDGDQEAMVVTGDTPPDGTPLEDVIAHEYGHHIARNRTNYPWSALDRGPKYWSTYENVCLRTRAGSAFPGDEGSHYALNPGEAWAETYRILNGGDTSAAAWGVDGSFYPNATDLAFARADVLSPWAGNSAAARRGYLASGRSRAWSFPVPNDGRLIVTLRSRGFDGDLYVYDARGRLLGRSATSNGRERVGVNVCGAATARVTAQVYAYGGSGGYDVSASVP